MGACISECVSVEVSVQGPKSPEDFFNELTKLGIGDSSVYWLLEQSASHVRANRTCVLETVKKNGLALDVAAGPCKADKEIVLAAVTQDSDAFSYVEKTGKVWNDKEFVLSLVTMQGFALQYAKTRLRADKEVVLAAVSNTGTALLYASNNMNEDKDVVLTAVQQDGSALQYASEDLRKNQEVVLKAVQKTPRALKYALHGLNQDPDCLKASGIWDPSAASYSRKEQAILSLKLGLAEKNTLYTTDFALAMKQDIYFSKFKTFITKPWSRESCDPKINDIRHKCRGTQNTCLFPEHDNLTAGKKLTNTSCNRFAFRYHLDQCKATNGFMIQVQEKHGLSDGQKIEMEMAQQAGIKIFRTLTTSEDVYGLWRLEQAVQDWYNNNCQNMDLTEIQLI